LQSTPHSKVNWTVVVTIRWPVFQVSKLRYNYASAGKQLRDVDVSHIAIMLPDTTALAKDI